MNLYLILSPNNPIHAREELDPGGHKFVESYMYIKYFKAPFLILTLCKLSEKHKNINRRVKGRAEKSREFLPSARFCSELCKDTKLFWWLKSGFWHWNPEDTAVAPCAPSKLQEDEYEDEEDGWCIAEVSVSSVCVVEAWVNTCSKDSSCVWGRSRDKIAPPAPDTASS